MLKESFAPPVGIAQSKIDALCIRALFKRVRKGEMVAPIATLFLCWVETDVVSMPLILTWAIFHTLANASSFLLSSRLLKHPPPDERMPFWHNWQVVIGSILGLTRGSAVLFFHVDGPNSFLNDLGVLVVLIAVSAVSVANTAPSFRTLAAYTSFILLIPAGYYLWVGDAQHVLFAFGIILLWAVELEVGRDTYEQFADGLRSGVINREISKQLEARNTQLDDLNRQLSTMAIHDKLTGLYNRHFIGGQLEQQHDLFVRYGTACSIVLLDIDYFKKVNDVYGHSVGDDVLVAFSRRIERQLRQGDIFARYGGEEFMLVLPITELAAATQLANRVRHSLANAPLIEAPVQLVVTASLGVAQIRKGDKVDDWLDRADQALYRAKASGRNCVMD